jgi:hypothetical protein
VSFQQSALLSNVFTDEMHRYLGGNILVENVEIQSTGDFGDLEGNG